MKRGIFGGSFNPPHMGHIQVMTEVQKKFGLDVIHMIPSNQNPLKISLEGPTSQQRLEMTELAIKSFGGQFIADDREIRRGGQSYTVDTLKELAKEFPKDSLHLILGADLFEQIDQWKNYSELFDLANIIVVA
ncbi:MAG: nicotinate (nicotinamide) nucleotide adenylyltransferase, partial [Pseudobdellovibrionaceae bacterium]